MFRYDFEKPWAPSDELVQQHGGVIDQARVDGRRHGQPFLLGPDARPDVRVNGFFASRRMRARSPLTWKKYAHALGLWLNFLLVLGRSWDQASEDDAECFKEWRLSEESNPRLVESSTFSGDLTALRSCSASLSLRMKQSLSMRTKTGGPVTTVRASSSQ